MKPLGQQGGNRYGLDAKEYENHSITISVIVDKPVGKISLYNKFAVILNAIFY